MIDTIFVIITSTIYSLIEIEIEGNAGWCQNLPTPVVTRLGSKNMTLYHIYMLLFIVTIVSFQTSLRYNLYSIIHTMSHIFIFIVLEDTMWFIFNPFYTIDKYSKDKIWWHSNQPWLFGIPSDIYKVVLSILLGSYLTNNKELIYSLILSVLYIPVTIYLAPYYHKYYINIHKQKSLKLQ